MKRLYVGIDLGVEVCALAAMNGLGQIEKEVEFATSEKAIVKHVEDLGGHVQVMIEECELAGWVYRMLKGRVARVVVSDPRKNAWIAKASNKSDKVDARKLAEYLRLNSFTEVYNPANEVDAAFKKLVQHEESLTKEVIKQKHRLQHRFRREGIRVRGEGLFTAAGKARLMGRLDQPIVRELIEHEFDLLEFKEGQRDRIRKRIAVLSRQFPVVSLLMTAPGVGPVLSARFSAHVQTPHRFATVRKLYRYSRMGIVDRSSDGKPLGRKRLDRVGNGALKDISRKIFIAATRCKKDNLFKRTYQRSLDRTKNATHARLNTQRKILAVLWSMWRNGTEFDDTVDGNRA